MNAKKRRLAVLGILFSILIISGLYSINSRQAELKVKLTYAEETQYITASAERLSSEHQKLTYEFRGPELLTLIETQFSNGMDVLVFEVAGEGITEMVFYSIALSAPDDTYAYADRCKISITEDTLDLDNRLWRR